MNVGWPKKIGCQDSLGKEAVPFGKRELSIGSSKGSNKVILEGADGLFGSVGTMFGRGLFLKLDVLLDEGLFEQVWALIVNTIEFRCVAVLGEELVGVGPGIADVGSLTVLEGGSMDWVSVIAV